MGRKKMETVYSVEREFAGDRSFEEALLQTLRLQIRREELERIQCAAEKGVKKEAGAEE